MKRSRIFPVSGRSRRGGLRGALALALSLGLPENILGRADVITICFALVAFPVFVQGMSMTPLVRRMGEIKEVGHE